MRIARSVFAAAAAFGALAPLAEAQELKRSPSRDTYVPSVADLMGMTQFRHVKLWFAGRLENWELADYELAQIKSSLQDAAAYYPGIPATDINQMAEPLRGIDRAIEQKDGQKFADSFRSLTAACNACHQGIGRAFIVIQVPTASPFSNQVFAPPGR